MMKKTIAIMLTMVLLLQPVMASAVTWGAVVGTINALRENGVELETEVEEDGEGTGTKVTVTGEKIEIKDGTITEVNIDDGSAGSYTFINVMVDGKAFTIHMDTGSASVALTEGTTVVVDKVNVGAVAENGSASLTVDQNSSVEAGSVRVYAENAGEVALDNSGVVSGDLVEISAYKGTVDVNNQAGAQLQGNGEEGEIRMTVHDGEGSFTNEGAIDSMNMGISAIDGGSVTATNNGTITVGDQLQIRAQSYNEELGEHGDKAAISFDNAGTIDAGRNTYIVALGDADTTFSNSGTVTNEVYSEAGYSEYSADDEEYLEAGSKVTEDMKASITITNTGTMTDYLATNSWNQGAMDVDNQSDIGDVYMNAFDNSSTNMNNSGSVSGELSVGVGGEAEGSVVNSGDVTNMYIFANESGEISAENAGTVSGDTWFDAMGDSSVTLNNTGTFENGIGSGADEGASLTVNNSGTVNGQIYSEGWGDANVTVNNTESGTTDSVWVNGMGNSQVSATNDGTVNGEFGGGVNESGSTVNLENNGQADSAWVTAIGGGSITMQNNSAIAGNTGVSTDGATDLSITQGENATGGEIGEIYIETGSNDVLSSEKIAQITENLNIGSDSVIHTVNADGQITAIYEVNEAGEVTLLESFVKVETVVDNGPSPEMIRHWMEELRQKQAIGGVYGSPYWLKQLYLGYHSLELRLYENGERELFREMLSWYEGGPEKRLTLRVNVENPQNLTMHLDGEVIDILERCEFEVITLQDKNKNVVMEYKVADLKAARALYNLARTDLLCVGGPDSQVMKIGADGKMVPVEQTAE